MERSIYQYVSRWNYDVITYKVDEIKYVQNKLGPEYEYMHSINISGIQQFEIEFTICRFQREDMKVRKATRKQFKNKITQMLEQYKMEDVELEGEE